MRAALAFACAVTIAAGCGGGDDDDTTAGSTTPAEGNCGEVSGIAVAAVGTDCATARRVAQAAQRRDEELSYKARGFDCTGERDDDASLPSIRWLCAGADRAVVTFVTS